MQKESLTVEGMSCGHCVKAIEGSVAKLDGVKSVQVSLEEKKVEVEFDDSQVKLDDIKETIDDQGYDVV
ncbi:MULTISPECIES: copper chaperone CopZ [Rossellomorea]|jgi:copper chaperone|uniref:copper chaperone CopZ n=1 Tax=Rossellomorea TaxID=2837508 RepID=UPI0011E94A68|nr:MULTISPECIES: copper chaperone CopZ [Rossellomorea]MDT9027373.1 copper chaperone CopZ [Rossellomorea sp. YC4-1]TYS91461.1 copper chaperone CopZ [Rossellomorea aquimaris]